MDWIEIEMSGAIEVGELPMDGAIIPASAGRGYAEESTEPADATES